MKDVELEAQDEEDRMRRSRRFDLALEKANYASLALRSQPPDEAADAAEAAIGGEDDEAQLQAFLAQV